MQKFLSLALLAALVFTGCSSDDDNNNTDDGGGEGDNPVTATYRVTFNPNWTEAQFPTDYPANAAFSNILVAVHAPGNNVFRLGQQASAGLQVFAETGDSSALATELTSSGSEDSVDFFVTSSAAGGGPTAAQSVNVTVDPEKTSISFVVSMTPSPDWFAGVDSFSIVLPSDALVSEETLTLSVLDAGTDSGDTYNAADNPTSPQGNISIVNTPPIGTSGGLTPAIGSITITRTDL
ncbi:spondin domain-containing protein [Gilvibacter sp.]|uniref:spondin domain-containing protein n=1 Tax=Gilvibacter sp. TaxID=2729997 RepID=UPI003F4A50A8